MIIVYFPKNYSLMHMLHTRKSSYVNIVYKCNRRDGCQRSRKFVIAGRHIEWIEKNQLNFKWTNYWNNLTRRMGASVSTANPFTSS